MPDFITQDLLKTWAVVDGERSRTPVLEPSYWDLKKRAKEIHADLLALDPDSDRSISEYRPLFTVWPSDRDELWRRVDRFIDAWCVEPLTRESGFAESELRAAEARLGTPLPAALKEWHRLAGRRRDLWDPPDPDGWGYSQPDIWSPDSFCWLGEQSMRIYVSEKGERDLADRLHPLVFSVLHGGCQVDCLGIRRDKLDQDDPTVSDFDRLAGSGSREGYDSITEVAVCLLLTRATQNVACSLHLGMEHHRGDPDLSRFVQAATAQQLLRKCTWFKRFFDVFQDVPIEEIYEGPDCFVVRSRIVYWSGETKSRDFLEFAFRTPQAAYEMTVRLGLLDRMPESWGTVPSKADVWL